MGVNRFTNIPQQEYISQFIPLDLDLINKVGQYKQGQYDTQQAELDKATQDLIVKGGYRTRDRAIKLNEDINNKLNNVLKELETDGSIKGGTARIKNIVREIKSNPELQNIAQDYAYQQEVDKSMKDQMFPKSVQNYYDLQNQQFKQTKPGEAFNPDWYNTVNPGNTNAEYSPLFKQVQPIISKIYDNPVTKSWTDENGNIQSIVLQEGIEAEELRKQQVKEAIAPYILEDPNALNQQSRRYSEALAKQQGREFTIENHLNEISNAFIGDYTRSKEIQKIINKAVSRPGTQGSSGSGSVKKQYEFPHRLADHIKILSTSQDGATKLTNKDMVAALAADGYDEKDGTYKINFTDSKPYLQIGSPTTSSTTAEEQIKLNNFVPLKAEYEKNKKAIIEEVENDASLVSGKIPNASLGIDKRTYKTADGKYYVNVIGADNYGLIDVNETNPRKTTKRMTRDEFIKYETENKLKIAEDNGSLSSIRKQAEDLGIDLNDKELYNKSKKLIEDEDLQKATVILQGLSGSHKVTSGSGKNAFMTDDGTIMLRNDIELTKADVEELFGTDGWFQDKGYKKLEEAKLIHKKPTKDAEGNEIYVVPVITEASGDVRNMAMRMQQAGNLTSDAATKDYIAAQDDAQQALIINQINLQKNKFNKEYDKNPELSLKVTDREISRIINNGETTGTGIWQDEEARIAANETKVKLINNIKNAKTSKDKQLAKEKLFEFKLLITDPDKYDLLKSLENDSGQDLGGVQEGWTTTPAKPLQ